MKERGPIPGFTPGIETEKFVANRVVRISKISDIEAVEDPGSVTGVHISKQAATSLRAVEKMLGAFENLNQVTANPSSYERLQGREQWWIIKDREIKVSEKRIRSQASYDVTPSTQAIKDKKVLYKSIFKDDDDPETKELLFKMDENGVINLDLIHMYLRGQRKTIDEVAKEAKINRNTVGNEIVVILSIMGYPYSEHTRELADMRVNRYKRIHKKEKLVRQEQKYRSSFSVTDGEVVISPPPTLNAKKLEKWKQINEVIVSDKDVWFKFCEDEPRISGILKQYLQLDEYRNNRISSKEIGNKHGNITIAGVNYLVNHGLKLLSGKAG